MSHLWAPALLPAVAGLIVLLLARAGFLAYKSVRGTLHPLPVEHLSGPQLQARDEKRVIIFDRGSKISLILAAILFFTSLFVLSFRKAARISRPLDYVAGASLVAAFAFAGASGWVKGGIRGRSQEHHHTPHRGGPPPN